MLTLCCRADAARCCQRRRDIAAVALLLAAAALSLSVPRQYGERDAYAPELCKMPRAYAARRWRVCRLRRNMRSATPPLRLPSSSSQERE